MTSNRPPSLLRFLRLIAFAVALLGSPKLVSAVLFYNSSFPAGGTVLGFAPNSEFLEPEGTPFIAFIDFRNQKQLALPISALGTGSMFLGQKVPIRYDPNRPEVFRIDTLAGMWGSAVIRILYGLIPYIILSFLMAASLKRAPARSQRPAKAPRIPPLEPRHLIRHKNRPASESGVVRRMR